MYEPLTLEGNLNHRNNLQT